MPDHYEDRVAAGAEEDLLTLERMIDWCETSRVANSESITASRRAFRASAAAQQKAVLYDDLIQGTKDCFGREDIAVLLLELHQENEELEQGIRELLTFLDNIRCGLAMSHSNATCVYYKELGEHFTKLTAMRRLILPGGQR